MDDTTSIRESLEEALDAVEQPQNDQVESAAPEALPPAELPDPQGQDVQGATPKEETPGDSRQRDEQGKFAKKPDEQGITPAPKAEPRKAPEERAPQSWKPETRQHWQALPAEVRAEVARREREFAVAMQETAEARKFSEAVMKTVAPYESFIRAEGSNPIQAIDHLMATAARLRTSTAPELAQMVSQMINQFGVGRFGNGFIEILDQALVGQTPQQNPQEIALQRRLEQEIAPVKQFMSQFQQMQQQQEMQLQQAAGGEVQSFLSQHEFAMDVKDDMADLIEMAHKRGRDMSLEEAYEKACRAHPSIGKIFAQRDKASQAQQTNQVAQRARAASVSVSGAPSIGSGSNNSDDLRAALENAFGAAGR